jgi:hypothetical protein
LPSPFAGGAAKQVAGLNPDCERDALPWIETVFRT